MIQELFGLLFIFIGYQLIKMLMHTSRVKKNNLEYSMLLRGAVAAATPPELVFAMKYHGKLEDYAKAMMEFDFKSSNLQLDDILQMFPVLKNNFIHGDFKTLEIKESSVDVRCTD